MPPKKKRSARPISAVNARRTPAVKQKPKHKKKLPSGRKMVALGIVIVLPLVLIAGTLGSQGSSSTSAAVTTTTGKPVPAPAGSQPMLQACNQLAALTQAPTTTTATTAAKTTTTTAKNPTTTPAATTPVTTAPAATTSTTNVALSMHQIAQKADSATQANPSWKAMAANIDKLNTLIQSNSTDQAGFTAQLGTVAKECNAMASSGGSPPLPGI